MCTYIIFGLLFSVFLNFYSVSTGHWIHLRSSMLSSFTDDVNDISNETDLTQKMLDSNETNTNESEVLFWAVPEKNDPMGVKVHTHAENESENINTFQSLEDVAGVELNETFIAPTNSVKEMDVHNMAEENKTNDIFYNDISHAVMDEKIVLPRNNCHLEIAIQEYHDLRIEIVFGKLQSNSGKCCITLNGQDNSKLGVLITNVHLYQNFTQGEILKVITPNYGSDFVLKEYYSWTKDQPLLLTETHKVYIVLYYEVKIVPPNHQDSHFNLEVFSYQKYENYVHQGTTYPESHFQYNNGA